MAVECNAVFSVNQVRLVWNEFPSSVLVMEAPESPNCWRSIPYWYGQSPKKTSLYMKLCVCVCIFCLRKYWTDFHYICCLGVCANLTLVHIGPLQFVSYMKLRSELLRVFLETAYHTRKLYMS